MRAGTSPRAIPTSSSRGCLCTTASTTRSAPSRRRSTGSPSRTLRSTSPSRPRSSPTSSATTSSHYLAETARVLKPGGTGLFTFFLLTPEAEREVDRRPRGSFPSMHRARERRVGDRPAPARGGGRLPARGRQVDAGRGRPGARGAAPPGPLGRRPGRADPAGHRRRPPARPGSSRRSCAGRSPSGSPRSPVCRRSRRRSTKSSERVPAGVELAVEAPHRAVEGEVVAPAAVAFLFRRPALDVEAGDAAVVDDPPARLLEAVAPVEVVHVEPVALVEQADLVHRGLADQHVGAVDGVDVAELVLAQLGGLVLGEPRAEPVADAERSGRASRAASGRSVSRRGRGCRRAARAGSSTSRSPGRSPSGPSCGRASPGRSRCRG